MKHYDYQWLPATAQNDNAQINEGVLAGFAGGILVTLIAWLFHVKGSVLAYVFLAGMIGSIVAFTTILSKLTDYDKKVAEFAAQNHLAAASVALSAVPDAATRQGADGAQIKYAHTLRLKNGTECTVYEYSYSVGSGKSEKLYDYSIAHFTVPAKFPELFLDGKQNELGSKYQGSQRIGLEGDFDKYFALFVPNGSQIDALSIISPDVMQLLVDEGRPYDVALNGHDVYVMSSEHLYTQRGLPSALEFCSRLYEELHHRSVSWREPLQAAAPTLKTDFWRTQKGKKTMIVAVIVLLLLMNLTKY